MAQTTILAAGTSAAVSSNVTVAAGSVVSIGVFSDVAIPAGVALFIKQDTPASSDNIVGKLTHNCRAVTISAPGTYRVSRSNISAGGVSVGAYLES